MDAAYPPFADGFSAEQHRYGPYVQIRAEIARPNQERGDIPHPNR